MNSYRNRRASLVEEPPRYNHSPFVHVYLSYNYTLPATNSLVVVPFDVAVVNENGCFAFGSTPRFTPSLAGRYVFLVNLGLFGVTNEYAFAEIRRYTSGGTLIRAIRPCGTATSAPNNLNLAGSAVLEANLGDYFELSVQCGGLAYFFGSNSGSWDNYQIYRLT